MKMEIPTYILFLLGCFGAADIALFHSVAHGIRSHPDSARELVTHSLRGPTYAALFLLIPNFAMQGLFAWGPLALFVFDVGISIWDFWLEQGSRRLFGWSAKRRIRPPHAHGNGVRRFGGHFPRSRESLVRCADEAVLRPGRSSLRFAVCPAYHGDSGAQVRNPGRRGRSAIERASPPNI
ncbi:hypothetical protein SBV1_1160008 [Verrucomicrobia bacterium]|nr:hypothetical protein SBV1_1160008 [Verrucomicrobiota bacterium]